MQVMDQSISNGSTSRHRGDDSYGNVVVQAETAALMDVYIWASRFARLGIEVPEIVSFESVVNLYWRRAQECNEWSKRWESLFKKTYSDAFIKDYTKLLNGNYDRRSAERKIKQFGLWKLVEQELQR